MMAELDFSKLFSWTAENDKDTTAILGVYKGRTAITVFKNRSIVAKIPFDKFGQIYIIRYVKKIMAGGPDNNISHTVQKYDFDQKKIAQLGTIVIGRNDKRVVYMGISAPGFHDTRFLFRVSLAWGSGDNEVEKSEVAVETFLNVIGQDLPNAIALTSEKFEGQGRTGNTSNRGSGDRSSSNNSGSDDIFF